MINPFLKRATEFYRDNEAFLALVSPEPVQYFLADEGKADRLYDRLVILSGTPGSGKTTLARLFEYQAISTLLRHKNMDVYKHLLAALADCKALADDNAAILGCRIPLETDYRDFWEFSYPDKLKCGLMTALIQSRAVLGWLRNLESSGVALDRIRIVPKPDAEAATQSIGGTIAREVKERARTVELALYRIVSALVEPAICQLEEDITSAYHPFDVIDFFQIRFEADAAGEAIRLRPLIIMDDAHVLHSLQLSYLLRWLTRRELRVARWVLTRLDALHACGELKSLLVDDSPEVDLPGIARSREILPIRLQCTRKERGARLERRKSFRKMAKDMSDRYLRRMSLFSDRGLDSLAGLLTTNPQTLPASKLKELRDRIQTAKRSLGISDARYEQISREVTAYLGEKTEHSDVGLGMLRILMHRYHNRTRQGVLFDLSDDPEPNKPLQVDRSVYDGARIHLLHEYGRPYFYGIDDVCDASSENAEQFLHLAAVLVETAAAQLIQSRPAMLGVRTQHKLLQQEAAKIIDEWSYPECENVRQLTNRIAEQCVAESVSPNAWLGPGANAFGIPQHEYAVLQSLSPKLFRVLQFAVAYNALTLVAEYTCKNHEWCLLELSGITVLKYGLPLSRGGFIGGSVSELVKILGEGESCNHVGGMNA